MKTYIKNGVANFSSPTSASSDTQEPTLQDSKSTQNLYQSVTQSRKFRETTYFPVTTKNTHRQFLRYTVNLTKSDKEISSANIPPIQDFQDYRKIAIEQPKKKVNVGSESPTIIGKANYVQNKIEKKNTNPQKKQQVQTKNTPFPKFLEKKKTVENTTVQSSNKTQRIQTQNTLELSQNLKKKTFTPKCNKPVDDLQPNIKIISSYSSTNLLKTNYTTSPTSLTSTTRFSIRQAVVQRVPCVSDFKKIKFLGQGKFGQVHMVQHIKTNSVFAMKQIKKQTIIKNKMQDQLLMEIKMQFYMNHPNILKLYGVFNDKQNIYLILQYMQQGTLYSLLKRKKVLKQADASHKLRDVIDGINYLHNQNIAHRDIKPQNIVISNDVCKICDFGWAAVCDDRRKTLCGTIDYASPQLLQGKQYGTAIDLWCLGVLCYELMVGKCPFYHISRKETMKKIINADLTDINLPITLPTQTKDFICKLLIKNPQQRMSAQCALLHPLITKFYDQDHQDIYNSQKRKL